MESKTIVVCAVLVVLGLVSVANGIIAQATRVKDSQLHIIRGPKCIYPSSPTMGLAIVAAVALVLVRITVRAATGGGCSCCQTLPMISKFARISILISWIASCIAVVQFLVGARFSKQNGVQMWVNNEYKCYTVRPWTFVVATIMAFVSVSLSLVYYLSYASAKSQEIIKSGLEVGLEAPKLTKDNNKTTIPPYKH